METIKPGDVCGDAVVRICLTGVLSLGQLASDRGLRVGERTALQRTRVNRWGCLPSDTPWGHRQTRRSLSLKRLLDGEAYETTQEDSVKKPLPSTAENISQTPDGVQTARQMSLQIMLAERAFPIGWESYPNGISGWLRKVTGLLISILAVMLGAPLLFDTLNNFIMVRFTVKPFE